MDAKQSNQPVSCSRCGGDLPSGNPVCPWCGHASPEQISGDVRFYWEELSGAEIPLTRAAIAAQIRERLASHGAPDELPLADLLVKNKLISGYELHHVMSSPDFVAGMALGDYQLLDKIGEGGFGVVFKARHILDGQFAAIKVLRSELTKEKSVLEAFRKEANIAKTLDSRYVVRVDSFETSIGFFYIVMELVNGCDLGTLLKKPGNESGFGVERAMQIGIQLSEGLEYIHRVAKYHRDIKPQNILIDTTDDSHWRVKIADFGLAKHSIESETPDTNKYTTTHTGLFKGTVRYASPEQLVGDKKGIDARTDIYSFGMVLYEMLTGKVPFAAEGDFEMFEQHLSRPPAPIRTTHKQLPLELENIVMKCLAKAPEDRHESARELTRRLRLAANTGPITVRKRMRDWLESRNIKSANQKAYGWARHNGRGLLGWLRWLLVPDKFTPASILARFAGFGLILGVVFFYFVPMWEKSKLLERVENAQRLGNLEEVKNLLGAASALDSSDNEIKQRLKETVDTMARVQTLEQEAQKALAEHHLINAEQAYESLSKLVPARADYAARKKETAAARLLSDAFDYRQKGDFDKCFERLQAVKLDDDGEFARVIKLLPEKTIKQPLGKFEELSKLLQQNRELVEQNSKADLCLDEDVPNLKDYQKIVGDGAEKMRQVCQIASENTAYRAKWDIINAVQRNLAQAIVDLDNGRVFDAYVNLNENVWLPQRGRYRLPVISRELEKLRTSEAMNEYKKRLFSDLDKLLAEQKFQDAENKCRAMLRVDPENADVKTKLAEVKRGWAQSFLKSAEDLRKQKRLSEAVTACREALNIDPTNPTTLLNDLRSELLADAKKRFEACEYTDALKAVEQTAKAFPKDSEIEKFLEGVKELSSLSDQAVLAEKNDNLAEAAELYNNIFQKNPADSSAKQKADALLKQLKLRELSRSADEAFFNDNYDDCLKTLSEIDQLEPDNERAKQLTADIGRIQTCFKQADAAEAELDFPRAVEDLEKIKGLNSASKKAIQETSRLSQLRDTLVQAENAVQKEDFPNAMKLGGEMKKNVRGESASRALSSKIEAWQVLWLEKKCRDAKTAFDNEKLDDAERSVSEILKESPNFAKAVELRDILKKFREIQQQYNAALNNGIDDLSAVKKLLDTPELRAYKACANLSEKISAMLTTFGEAEKLEAELRAKKLEPSDAARLELAVRTLEPLRFPSAGEMKKKLAYQQKRLNNKPPVFTESTPQERNADLFRGEKAAFSAAAKGPEPDDSVTLSWSVKSRKVADNVPRWEYVFDEPGEQEVVVTARDSFGAEATCVWKMNVGKFTAEESARELIDKDVKSAVESENLDALKICAPTFSAVVEDLAKRRQKHASEKPEPTQFIAEILKLEVAPDFSTAKILLKYEIIAPRCFQYSKWAFTQNAHLERIRNSWRLTRMEKP